jgi:hypothetical protein
MYMTQQNATHKGRAIAQAISRWLPTMAARVRARVWSCGICGGQSGAGAGFLRVLWFPLPNFIPPVSPQSPSSIIWGWYNRPIVAAVPSGLSLTPLTIIIKNATHKDWCAPFNCSRTWLSWTFLVAHSKAKVKRNGVKASPSFRPFLIGKLSDKCYLFGLYYTFRSNTFQSA